MIITQQDCFGDSRIEEQLLIEILNFKQNPFKLEEYYSHFVELAQLLILKADPAQHNFYTNLVLKRFISNLFSPLSAAVKSLNPQNLPQAYQKAKEFVIEHPDYYCLQQPKINKQINSRSNFPHKKFISQLSQANNHQNQNSFISQFPQNNIRQFQDHSNFQNHYVSRQKQNNNSPHFP